MTIEILTQAVGFVNVIGVITIFAILGVGYMIVGELKEIQELLASNNRQETKENKQ